MRWPGFLIFLYKKSNAIPVIRCLPLVSAFKLLSCTPMLITEKPVVATDDTGYFIKTKEGGHLYVFDYKPGNDYSVTVFIISGITGINHNNENE